MVPTADLPHLVPTIVALGLLAIAALHDVGFRTLPDTVSIALAACGIALHLTDRDLGAAVLTAFAVFVLASLARLARLLGGGDVKLLGATAFAVPLAAVPLLLIGTVLAGGLLALGFLGLQPFVPAIAGPRPVALLARVLRVEAWRIRRRGPLPYGVAIATGGAVSLLNG